MRLSLTAHGSVSKRQKQSHANSNLCIRVILHQLRHCTPGALRFIEFALQSPPDALIVEFKLKTSSSLDSPHDEAPARYPEVRSCSRLRSLHFFRLLLCTSLPFLGFACEEWQIVRQKIQILSSSAIFSRAPCANCTGASFDTRVF